MRRFAGLVLLATAVLGRGADKPPDVGELLFRARVAKANGNGAEAIRLATSAIELAPKNPNTWFLRAALHAAERHGPEAVADYSRVVELQPRAAEAFQLRAVEQFKLGHFDAAVADFDRHLELNPAARPHHWQRGIALYYAKRYEEGRRQFELHQTVNPDDVENAVWHFLCVARLEGVEHARAALLKIREDARVPMMQVYALFKGEGSVDAVLAAVEAGQPSPKELELRRLYAHLYLALYHDIHGELDSARAHIARAVQHAAAHPYMGEVARVHQRVLEARSAAGASAIP